MKNYMFPLKRILLLLFIPLVVYGQTVIENGLITDQLDVDNVRIDGNTLSTTNTNGDFTLDPNGTGSIIFNDLTASRVPYLDASKKLKASSITDTELGRLTGIGSVLCGISDSCTLTNKVLSGNTATNLISGSGTFTFNTTGTLTAPNATDTLVGRATTDTLTNKTLTGNTAVNLISGSGTFVHNTTGTITAPNATDTLVGKATTDTLTNKTLTAPIISTISNTGTLTLPTSTDTLVGRATTDTLTNKTLTSATLTTPTTDVITLDDQGSTPSTPSSGFYKLYAKTDGKVYKLSPAGTETEIGAGGAGGSSGINMLGAFNGNAELGATTNWSETGGGTLAVTSTAADVANGTYALSFDCSANADYVESDSRTIPAGLYGKNCLAEAYLKGFDANTTLQVTDGTNVLNSVVLAANSLYTKHQLNFVCPQSGSLKFKILCTGNAAIGYMDEVHLGSATNVGDTSAKQYLGALTTTGAFTTNTTYVGKYWRDADFLIGQVYITFAGAPNAVNQTLNLPNGLTIDTTKLGVASSVQKIDGGFRADNPGDNSYEGYLAYASTTSMGLYRPITANGNAFSEIPTGNLLGGTAPFTIGSGDSITVWYRVPISGWSPSQAINPNQVRNPTRTVLSSGTSQTYTVPANVTHLRVRLVGGGGGGRGTNGAGTSDGGAGGNSSFTDGTLTLTAAGGAGGILANSGGPGGTSSAGGDIVIYGGNPGVTQASSITGATGGGSLLAPPTFGTIGGGSNATGYGAGGSSGAYNGSNAIGGAGGGYVEKIISNPSPTYTYSVGAGGTAGGGAAWPGGTGAGGVIIIDEFYAQNAPVLVGSLTSNSITAERIERAIVGYTGGVPAASPISGSWITSVSDSSTGILVLNIPTGIFSALPTCVASAINNGNNTSQVISMGSVSTTSVQVIMRENGTVTDINFHIICMGPR